MLGLLPVGLMPFDGRARTGLPRGDAMMR
jgi:hypothetical protein